MRIFNWVHRKFRQNPRDYTAKDSFNGHWSGILQDSPLSSKNSLDERATRVRIPHEDKVTDCIQIDPDCSLNNSHDNIDAKNEDTEALLGSRDSKVAMLLRNWENGLLTIGTFGIDQGNCYGSLDGENFGISETDNEEELIDPIEMEVLEEKLEEVFGSAGNSKISDDYHMKAVKAQQWENKGYTITDCNKEYSIKDLLNSGHGNNNDDYNNNNGNKIYPLQEYFEVPLLAETVRKKEHRTTLADLFSRSKNQASSTHYILDDRAKIEYEHYYEQNKIKQDEKHMPKSGRSFVKKVLKWKGGGGGEYRPKKWVMKMLRKKIYPETIDDLHARELMDGHLDISKTFVNASKLKELQDSDKNSVMRSTDPKSISANPDYELVSLLRDSSKGSQECWIKTDSEYVVLEL